MRVLHFNPGEPHMSSSSLPIVGHWIDGKNIVESPRSQEVFNPATGAATKRVLLADRETVRKAILSAEKAFPAWRNTPRCVSP